jgi:hypothetical protein
MSTSIPALPICLHGVVLPYLCMIVKHGLSCFEEKYKFVKTEFVTDHVDLRGIKKSYNMV